MKVRITCFGILRDHLPSEGDGGSISPLLAPGATVRDAAAAAGLPLQHLFAVLVNGERAGLSTGLHDGDEVTFMPPFSGGN